MLRKKGLQADKITLWACIWSSSQASVTSKKSLSSRSSLNAPLMLVSKSFHRRQNFSVVMLSPLPRYDDAHRNCLMCRSYSQAVKDTAARWKLETNEAASCLYQYYLNKLARIYAGTTIYVSIGQCFRQKLNKYNVQSSLLIIITWKTCIAKLSF